MINNHPFLNQEIWDANDAAVSHILDHFHILFDSFQDKMTQYQCAALEVETRFRVLNMSISHKPVESIKTRIKTPESIIRKLTLLKQPVQLETMEEYVDDIAGIRVICSFIDDIYQLKKLLLKQDDIDLVYERDYIQTPKKSGYRSLHLVVTVPIFTDNGKTTMKVEIQMRTIAMDCWASLEHKLRYKKNLSSEMIGNLGNKLEKCAMDSAKLDWQMQSIRNELLLAETKKGELEP